MMKSDDSLHLDGSEEEEFLDGTEPKSGDFLVVKVPTKKSFRNYVGVVCDCESDGFQVQFWKRLAPSSKFTATEEMSFVRKEEVIMKLPKPSSSGGTTRQSAQFVFHVDLASYSV